VCWLAVRLQTEGRLAEAICALKSAYGCTDLQYNKLGTEEYGVESLYLEPDLRSSAIAEIKRAAGGSREEIGAAHIVWRHQEHRAILLLGDATWP